MLLQVSHQSEMRYYTPLLNDLPIKNTNKEVYVVVQFYPWFKFYFPLFLGMVMYDNEFETKENKTYLPRIKLNHNIY